MVRNSQVNLDIARPSDGGIDVAASDHGAGKTRLGPVEIELIVGLFVSLGLWTSWALRGALVLFGIFVVVVGQALIRALPLESCGCFGEWIHLKPQTVIIMDSTSLLLVILLLRNISLARKFSLDSYFDKA